MEDRELIDVVCFGKTPALLYILLIVFLASLLMCIVCIVLFILFPKLRFVFGKHVLAIVSTYLLITIFFMASFFTNIVCWEANNYFSPVYLYPAIFTHVVLLSNIFIVSNLNIDTYVNLRRFKFACCLTKWSPFFYVVWGVLVPLGFAGLSQLLLRIAFGMILPEFFFSTVGIMGRLAFVLPVVLFVAIINFVIICLTVIELRTYGHGDQQLISEFKQKISIGVLPFLFELFTELLFVAGPYSGKYWVLFYALNPLQGLVFGIYLVFYCFWDVISQEVKGKRFFWSYPVHQHSVNYANSPELDQERVTFDYGRMES